MVLLTVHMAQHFAHVATLRTDVLFKIQCEITGFTTLLRFLVDSVVAKFPRPSISENPGGQTLAIHDVCSAFSATSTAVRGRRARETLGSTT